MGAVALQGRQQGKRDALRDTRAARLAAHASRIERVRVAYAATITLAERVRVAISQQHWLLPGDTIEAWDQRIAAEIAVCVDAYNEHGPGMVLDPQAREIAKQMADFFGDEGRLRVAVSLNGTTPIANLRAEIQRLENSITEREDELGSLNEAVSTSSTSQS